MRSIDELYQLSGLSDSSSNDCRDPLLCFDLGDRLFESKRFAEALDVYWATLKTLDGSVPDSYKERKASALRNMGEMLVQKGSLSEALQMLTCSWGVFQELGDYHKVCVLLNMIGIVHKKRDDFLECLTSYDRGLKIAEENGFMELEAKILYNTGNLFIVFRTLADKAMEYFTRAEKVYEKLHDKRGLGYVLSAKAQLHSKAGQMEECLELSRRSLELRQEAGTDFEIGYSLRNLGGHLDSEKNPIEKERALLNALRIGRDSGLISLQAESMLLLSIFHLDLNQLKEAENYLDKVFSLISDSEGFNYIKADALDTRIQLGAKKEDWNMALCSLEEKRALEAELNREDTLREIKAVLAGNEMEFLRRHKAFLVEKKKELSMINGRLRDSVASARRLRGLLPVCTACGRVRDDEGYWKKIDDYLENQVGMKLSHSLCESCHGRIYTEQEDEGKAGPSA